MALNIYGYGLHFYNDDSFIKNNKELIDSIRKEIKNLDWQDKIILGIGGGNSDLSYFVGVYIDTVEYGSITITQAQEIFSQKDYVHLLSEKLAQYPMLQQALKDHLYLANGQIILDLE